MLGLAVSIDQLVEENLRFAVKKYVNISAFSGSKYLSTGIKIEHC
jgi:hypothetical protein